MAAFAIIAPTSHPVLAGVIQRTFAKHFEFSPGQFVVAENGLTAQQVGLKIPLDGSVGKFVVFSIAGFWGYHDKALWEWLTLNSG